MFQRNHLDHVSIDGIVHSIPHSYPPWNGFACFEEHVEVHSVTIFFAQIVHYPLNTIRFSSFFVFAIDALSSHPTGQCCAGAHGKFAHFVFIHVHIVPQQCLDVPSHRPLTVRSLRLQVFFFPLSRYRNNASRSPMAPFVPMHCSEASGCANMIVAFRGKGLGGRGHAVEDTSFFVRIARSSPRNFNAKQRFG